MNSQLSAMVLAFKLLNFIAQSRRFFVIFCINGRLELILELFELCHLLALRLRRMCLADCALVFRFRKNTGFIKDCTINIDRSPKPNGQSYGITGACILLVPIIRKNDFCKKGTLAKVVDKYMLHD